MLINIVHRTRYHYSSPVYLEPFTVRLRPRSNAIQTLRKYHIDVTPAPSGLTHCIGLDDNNTETIWFSGMHDDLLIEVHTLVETHYGDSFNFLITDPAALSLPLTYQPQLARALGSYLIRDSNDVQVATFTQEVLAAANNETILFLTTLAETLYQRIEYVMREEGEPWTPAETMQKHQGSCRDTAMLYVDMCRSVGIAARFVSGYCIGDAAVESDMHAWAEVFLPGVGWRGFDPSRGLSTSDDYISVASGQRAQEAAPTFGSFRGDAQSTLTAELSISVLKSETTII